MKRIAAALASWMFRKLQGADLYLTLSRLRDAGHAIHPTATFGPRTQIHVHDGASLRIGPEVEVLNDNWLIAHPGDELTLGDRVFISQHCTVSGTVSIGADTLIAGYVTIIDANHVISDTTRPIREQGGNKRPITIGSDVWIGAHAVILQGVTIGDGAVVAANATVTHDVPPHAVVGGTPARVIARRGAP
jgi:acetyltransferase-like isoleucine patch superfamily enzyme